MASDDASPFADPPISMFMGGEVLTIAPSTSLRAAATQLNDAEVGLLVVGDKSEVQAVISERDIVRAVATGVDIDAVTVIEAGSTNLRWTTEGAPVAEVVDEMMNGYLRHILVRAESGELAGLISMRDLLGAFPNA